MDFLAPEFGCDPEVLNEFARNIFVKFCMSIGRMRSQQADKSDWNPTLCPAHTPTRRTLSPYVSWVTGRMLGKGAGLFLSQTSTSGELASVLLLERPSANVLQQQVGGHLPWDGTQSFYMKDFNYLSLPRVGGVLCTREMEKDTPQQFISWPWWCHVPGQHAGEFHLWSSPPAAHLLKHTLDRDGICCLGLSTMPPHKSLGRSPWVASASGTSLHISFCPSLSLSFIFYPAQARCTCSGLPNS